MLTHVAQIYFNADEDLNLLDQRSKLIYASDHKMAAETEVTPTNAGRGHAAGQESSALVPRPVNKLCGVRGQ